MTRRNLLQILTAEALAAAPPAVRLGCQTNAWPVQGFEQFLEILRRIRKLGFSGFETGFRNIREQASNPVPARKAIEASGLVFTGVHIFLLEYDKSTGVADQELIRSTVDTGSALGAERLILSGQAVNTSGKVDGAALERKADALNRAGAYCASKGMKVAYHNHHLEFAGGGAEMEGLLSRTDPGSVRLLLDAGHAFIAGVNIPEFFGRHHGRIDGMHLRDFRNGSQVPLGQGEFEFDGLVRAIRASRWTGWVIAEEERPNDVRPGESVVVPARQHLKKVFGV